MLVSLAVRDFVIVDALELSFKSGFTVLTGETGAGKSLLIDALMLALGGRGESALVRSGRDRAEIAAEFDVSRLEPVESWLRDQGLEADAGVCLVRRVLENEGRSRAFVNGHALPIQQLRELGDMLVDIHGQFAHQSLLKADVQRQLLDDFGGLGDLAAGVKEAHSRCRELGQQLAQANANAGAIERECQDLERQIHEIKTLALESDTWTQLAHDQAKLANAANLIEGVQHALDGLQEGEFAGLAQLNAVLNRIRGLVEYDPALEEIASLIEAAHIQAQEAARSLRNYLQRLELDPQRLAITERRMSEIHAVARKYRAKPDELPKLLNESQARLAALDISANVAALARQEEAARAEYLELGRRLSDGRRKAAATFGGKVAKAMQSLAMTDARFEVNLIALDEGASYGLEKTEFLFASHRSLALGPLDKIASGGELSRVGLAIQVVASKVARVPTLIFDEVDSGIGGGVAEVVGQMLKALGKSHQVMCVTHLPQVAAQGDQHWKVFKEYTQNAVTSRIEVLDKSQRIEELARMLGGVTITAATRKHAAELLGANA